jgi:hypothetical protein
MANYRDYALAAFQARKDAVALAAKEALRPLMTDAAGKVVLDPVGKTDAVKVDDEARMVVLTTNDGSGVSFGVYPEKSPVERYIATLVDGQWQRGPRVETLDEVGEAIAEGRA